MKLLALLCFYDEEPDDLTRCVASLALAGVAHVVAVDGRYDAFPGPATTSPPEQLEAITRATYLIGAGLTLHQPARPWQGNECEKRTFMHDLALTVSDHCADDWHLVIDADEVVDAAPANLHDELERTSEDVAYVMAREVGGGEAPRRRLFRSAPLRIGPSHARYVGDHDEVLSDNGVGEVPALHSGLVLSHRRSLRSAERLDRKRHYYEEFTEGGHLLCEKGCGRQATQRVRTGWRVQGGLPVSDPMDCCQWCANNTRAASAVLLITMGFNPDRVAL